MPELQVNQKILAIVVTYYPERELLEKSISAFIEDVDSVLIWENTPAKDKLSYRFIRHEKVEYCGDGTNSISHALNFAWQKARMSGYDYVLTMDQDSVWDDFHPDLTIRQEDTFQWAYTDRKCPDTDWLWRHCPNPESSPPGCSGITASLLRPLFFPLHLLLSCSRRNPCRSTFVPVRIRPLRGRADPLQEPPRPGPDSASGCCAAVPQPVS